VQSVDVVKKLMEKLWI